MDPSDQHNTPSRPLISALTIAGSDSGAGAGIQVDLLTFAANGVYGTTAITCLTAQNPTGVSGIEATPANFVIEQCQQVIRHFKPRALKTGMLLNKEIVEAVAQLISSSKILSVIDPVMVASSGASLLSPDAVQAVKKSLIPQATLVTPNLDEASILLGKTTIGGRHCEAEARELAQLYRVPFLLKGGHAQGDDLIDVLAWPDGKTFVLKAKRIKEIDTHGSGCTLSAAITAHLALGKDLKSAVIAGHAYLQTGMSSPISVAGLKQIKH
jgi:hydroxymethylpyrimidine/phosphomethylpyrimidine kinase